MDALTSSYTSWSNLESIQRRQLSQLCHIYTVFDFPDTIFYFFYLIFFKIQIFIFLAITND